MASGAGLVGTLVSLADTLVDDFDIVDLLTLLADRCIELFDVSAAGVMLATPAGELRVIASSSEAMRIVELFELQAEEGPCLDAYRTGKPVVHDSLGDTSGRWPAFAPVALDAGFRSVLAVPMRLRGSLIGAINLFRSDEGHLDDTHLFSIQALADVATIAVLQHRTMREAQILNEQLNHALNSRIVIEQAKGVVAERAGVTMEDAFNRLRSYARSHNVRLSDVALACVNGTLAVEALSR